MSHWRREPLVSSNPACLESSALAEQRPCSSVRFAIVCCNSSAMQAGFEHGRTCPASSCNRRQSDTSVKRRAQKDHKESLQWTVKNRDRTHELRDLTEKPPAVKMLHPTDDM